MAMRRSIEQVQEDYTEKWLNISGVEATAIGLENNNPCIIVFSSIEAKKLRERVPSTVEGYPVIIKQTDKFHALGNQ